MDEVKLMVSAAHCFDGSSTRAIWGYLENARLRGGFVELLKRHKNGYVGYIAFHRYVLRNHRRQYGPYTLVVSEKGRLHHAVCSAPNVRVTPYEYYSYKEDSQYGFISELFPVIGESKYTAKQLLVLLGDKESCRQAYEVYDRPWKRNVRWNLPGLSWVLSECCGCRIEGFRFGNYTSNRQGKSLWGFYPFK